MSNIFCEKKSKVRLTFLLLFNRIALTETFSMKKSKYLKYTSELLLDLYSFFLEHVHHATGQSTVKMKKLCTFLWCGLTAAAQM